MASTEWQVWADTGGTFTDCLAKAPDGSMQRLKVLSSSTLRGTVTGTVGEALSIRAGWGTEHDIFEGYRLVFPGLMDGSMCHVLRTDLKNGLLWPSGPLPAEVHPGTGFEIGAGEAAPILAARLATGTPLARPLPTANMRLGTTKGTNALLERKGAKTCLVVTRGFADLLHIGSQQRPDIFALDIRRPQPLHAFAIEAHERMSAQGEAVHPLTREEAHRVAGEAVRKGAETVAVALLHSYRNPAHELMLGEALAAAGIADISLSHQLAPAIKLLPRAQTAVANAYLAPVLGSYLDAVESRLSGGKLYLMGSAGGLTGRAFFQPKESLLSGPAGGVAGAAAIARQSGHSRILTFDMGGTSTDTARYDGGYDYRFETRAGDAHVFSPSLAIETVAAGGGSVCGFDGYALTVGPESAGSNPGPACYGAGGPLTVTDVNLLLGRADAGRFAIPLNVQAAEKAFGQLLALVREKAGPSVRREDLLAGLLQIANEKMAGAIRGVSAKRGFAPGDHALLAFGGAGGQHACQIAALLGINRILVPYDAGLLSAFGMGHSPLERFAQRQVLEPYARFLPHLADTVAAVSGEALAALRAEGVAAGPEAIRQVLIFLRFKGQETALEIPYSPGTDVAAAFRAQYEQQYGHWVEGRPLEVESVKAVAATQPTPLPLAAVPAHIFNPPPAKTSRLFSMGTWHEAPAYRWEDLPAGTLVAGPALVSSNNSTLVVETGWEMRLDTALTARLDSKGEPLPAMSQPMAEAATAELFANRFMAIATEMGAMLERTAFSVNVKERLDFSCALLDGQGRLLANAPHIPVHLGSLGLCTRAVDALLSLEEGDVAITNHPGYGGSHLPDITLVAPVFAGGQKVGYVANRAHHAEIGGVSPGSMPVGAASLAEEGVVIAPMLLVEKGEYRPERLETLLLSGPWPSRAPAENMADVDAALASLRTGGAALAQLCAQHGTEAVTAAMNAVKNRGKAVLLQALAPLAGKSFSASDTMDGGEKLQVRIAVGADSLGIDFTGSAGVSPHGFNANPAIVNSVVMYLLRLLAGSGIPLNEGLMEAVDVVLPPGMLNPPFPADPAHCPAVAAGNTETSQRLTGTLLKALGLAAGSQGTMNNLLFGNSGFGYYETICGGVGAGPGFHGAHAVHQHMTNTRITDPEIMEHRYPVVLEGFAIRKGSGGKGRWQGGDGVVRTIRFLAPVTLTMLTQHRTQGPYGLEGGQPGLPGRQVLHRAGGTTETLPFMARVEIRPGDRLEIETPGGGGYGPVE